MQFFGNAGGVLWNLSWKDPSDLKKIMIKITSKIKKKIERVSQQILVKI